VQRVQELVKKGLDAEPEYVELINKLDPKMTAERRKELIRQFRDAVYEQQPDLPGR
jgi:ribosome recycling factor